MKSSQIQDRVFNCLEFWQGMNLCDVVEDESATQPPT